MLLVVGFGLLALYMLMKTYKKTTPSSTFLIPPVISTARYEIHGTKSQINMFLYAVIPPEHAKLIGDCKLEDGTAKCIIETPASYWAQVQSEAIKNGLVIIRVG